YRSGKQVDRQGRGLALKALDLLLKAKSREIDPEGAIWQFQLLLTMGMIKEVRDRLPELKGLLARVEKELKSKRTRQLAQLQSVLAFSLHWFEALSAAAAGNYDDAHTNLEEVRKNVTIPRVYLEVFAGSFLQGVILRRMLEDRPIILPGYMPI